MTAPDVATPDVATPDMAIPDIAAPDTTAIGATAGAADTGKRARSSRNVLGTCLLMCLLVGGATQRGLLVDAVLQVLVVAGSAYVLASGMRSAAARLGAVLFALDFCRANYRQIRSLPRILVKEVAILRSRVHVTHNMRVTASLGVIKPDAEHVCVGCRLRADGYEERILIRALRRCDCVDEVVTRPTHLTDFVKDCDDWRETMCGCSLCCDGLVLDV